MSTAISLRPETGEYAPYYGKYISLVPEGSIVSILGEQLNDTLSLLRSIPEAQSDKRYAPEKWSIKELVGHVSDTERIFGYRALRFARNDKTPLSGFDQDEYVRNAAFDKRQLNELAVEFEYTRRLNISLFQHLDSKAWQRTGIANDSEASVRALAFIIAGHELHHMKILRTLYLSA